VNPQTEKTTPNLSTTTRTFPAWLAMQRDRSGPIGSLARDAVDERFSTPDELRQRMVAQDIIPDALRALDRAAKEWRQSQPVSLTNRGS
jgi:hypothetical protein